MPDNATVIQELKNLEFGDKQDEQEETHALRILFTQFRLGNTKLPIETDRWFNIYKNERYCTLCNIMNFINRFNVTL